MEPWNNIKELHTSYSALVLLHRFSHHHLQPSSVYSSSSHHHVHMHRHNQSPSSSFASSYAHQSSAILAPSSGSSSDDSSSVIVNMNHNNPPPADPTQSAPHHLVIHYIKQGLENIQNNLTVYSEYIGDGSNLNLAPSLDMTVPLQHRQFQTQPEDYTTMISTNMTNGLMNGNHIHQSSEEFDESVFSLMTLRNAMIISFYSLIILVSLTGNLLVCKVAFKRDMRTTTNLLIASLACSDIVMTVFNIPFNVVRMLPISWPFGELICVLVPLIQTSCVYVSTFTMTLIALHRLWTVRSRKTIGKTSICKVAMTVLAIWLIALTLSLPHAAFNRVRSKVFMGRVLTRCMVQLPRVSFNFPLMLTVEVLITQYLLPLSITLVVYVKIGRVIARQGQLICKLSDEKKRKQSEAKRRRIFMLALAVATFATCWAPINLYLFLVDIKLVKLQTNIFITCHWFAMSSVCYNLIIYCWLNEKFRNGAKQIIRAVLNLAHFPMVEKQTNSTNSTILSI